MLKLKHLECEHKGRILNQGLSLRGHRLPGFQHHLDLVLGAGEQLDGARLAEARPIHLEEHRALVGLDLQADGDVDDRREVVHGGVL